MEELYTYILTPDLTDIDINNIAQYSCYDDKCLISTFFRDEILDFLSDNKIKYINYILDDKLKYRIIFKIDKTKFENVFDKLIYFETGRFKCTSIYVEKNNEWIKVWKKGKRNNE